MVAENAQKNSGSSIPIIDTSAERTKWRLTVLLLAAALSAEIYFLLNDIPLLASKSIKSLSTAPPIAELVTARNSVKVQAPGDLVWDDAGDGQVLYRRQSLLTSDHSKAEIAFLDGTGIVVDENSLIQVEKTPGNDSLGYERITIRLLRGAIHKSEPRKRPDVLRKFAAETPAIDVEFGGGSVATLSAASELSIRSSGEVSVRSGEVSVKPKSGAAVTVRQGEEARVSPEGNMTSRKLSFTLLSPRVGESAEAGKSVRFRWNVDSAATSSAPTELELSQDAGFEKVLKRVTIPAVSRPLKHVETDMILPEEASGKPLYWRVKTAGRAASASSPSKLFVLAPKRAQPKLPAQNASTWAEKPVELIWESVEGAQIYQVDVQGQISETRETFSRVERLPAGTTSWRIRPRFADGTLGSWSEERKLRVLASPPEGELPPPDELDVEVESAPAVEPKPVHTWLDWIVSSAFAQTGDGRRVTLKWKPVKGAKKYRVQISKTRDFKDVMVEVQADSPQWVWTYQAGMENSKGRVYYRVASVSDSGKPGKFSSAKPVQLQQVTQLVFKAKEPAVEIKAESKTETKKPETYSAVDPSSTSEAPAEAPKAEVRSVPSSTVEAPVTAANASGSSRTSSFSVAAGVGIGNFNQTGSGGNLSQVQMQKPFLQQHFLIDLLTAEEKVDHWIGSLKANFASFESPVIPGQRGVEQPDVNAFAFRLDVVKVAARTPGQGAAGIGFVIDRSYRWVKTGAQSVEAQGAISVGPTLRYSQDFGYTRSGVMLSLPVTGLLTGGQAGVLASIWSEWRGIPSASWIGARIQGEVAYTGWKKPHSTQTTSWNFWIAPIIHFNHSDEEAAK